MLITLLPVFIIIPTFRSTGPRRFLHVLNNNRCFHVFFFLQNYYAKFIQSTPIALIIKKEGGTRCPVPNILINVRSANQRTKGILTFLFID